MKQEDIKYVYQHVQMLQKNDETILNFYCSQFTITVDDVSLPKWKKMKESFGILIMSLWMVNFEKGPMIKYQRMVQMKKKDRIKEIIILKIWILKLIKD